MDSLIKQLQNPALYDHPVEKFELIETHLSWVLLTGPYVYKIKKPVDLGFADFSTLEKRHHFCEEEIRLNKHLAGRLYEKLLPLYGTPEAPSFTPNGEIIEYVIQLKQFSQDELFTILQEKKTLTPEMFSSIAKQIADFHATAAIATAKTHFGNFESVSAPALDNYRHCKELKTDAKTHQRLNKLQAWTEDQLQKLKPIIEQRKAHGFVKSCHGDLHLGNIALSHGEPVIFDCIEFNDDFHWVDVMNEVAFLSMDLLSKGETKLSTHFINEYLFQTGDYAGLSLFPFYLVYRAMVRAKVALLIDINDSGGLFEQYLSLAESLTKNQESNLILMHGVSGTGKSYLSQKLSGSLQAIWIRSDIERKRIASESESKALYQANMTDKTYDHLKACAKEMLQAKFSVIVDATFLKAKYRQQFIEMAESLNSPVHIIHCQANEQTLRARIEERQKQGNDPSEATLEVLEMQQQQIEPLTKEEQRYVKLYQADNQTTVEAIEEMLAAC